VESKQQSTQAEGKQQPLPHTEQHSQKNNRGGKIFQKAMHLAMREDGGCFGRGSFA
jgi:hypothetical protein